MTTSGTNSYTQTKGQVVNDAFQLLTIYGVGESVSAEDYTFASNMLNKMIKAWEAKGLHLWTKTEAVLFFNQYQEKYQLGGTAKAANYDNVVTTRLTANVNAGINIIPIESSVGMNINDNIGIVQNDRSLFWTTITAINTNNITLASPLNIASTDQFLVYNYTNPISKPMRILEYARVARGFDSGLTSTLVETPVSIQAYMDYMALPTKLVNTHMPTQFMYNPNVDTTDLYLFPRPSDCSYRLFFTYERKIEDITDVSDTFDFPSEWMEALTYQLAIRLARPFGRAAALQDLMIFASNALEDLLAWDAERDYIEIQPCNWG